MSLGFSAEEARAWDMDIVLAEPWIELDCWPEQAHACLDAGLDAKGVGWWLNRCFLIEDVLEAFIEGVPVPNDFHNEDAAAWLDSGYDLKTAFWYMRAHIPVGEVATFPLSGSALRAFVVLVESSA